MISEAFSPLCPDTSAWLGIWNAAYQPSNTQVNTITWSLLESDVNITSDTTYCIILAPLRKTLNVSSLQTKLSIKLLSCHLKWLTIMPHLYSPLCPSIYHIVHPNQTHHSPNVSHALPHPNLFSGCFFYLEPLPLEEVFPALGVFPADFSTELPPVVTILPQLRCYLPWFWTFTFFHLFSSMNSLSHREIISRLWKYIFQSGNSLREELSH